MLVALLYGRVLHGPFVYDDANLEAEPLLHVVHLREIGQIFSAHGVPRKVGLASFALNYFLTGFDPWSYHLVNVGLHALNGVLLLALARRLSARLPPGQSLSFGGLVAGATVWLVHPVQTQAVSYVWQRFTILAACLVLLCLLAVTRAWDETGWRKGAWWTVAAAMGLLALGSKENAAALPVLVLVLDVLIRGRDRPRPYRRWLIAGVAVLVVGITASLLGPRWVEMIVEDSRRRGFTPWQRTMTEWRVIVHYLGLLVWPHPFRLNLDYDFPLSTSWLQPITTAACGLALLGALIAGLFLGRTHPLPALAILWFLVNLSIESTFIPLDLVYEHRLYLPSMMLLVVVVGSLFDRLRGLAMRPILAAAVGGTLAFWTWERNAVWADPFLLLQDNVRKAPAHARARWNLGRAYLLRGDAVEAERETAEALRLDPSLTGAAANLAAILVSQGRVEDARSVLEDALRRRPHDVPASVNLGLVYLRLARPDQAVAVLDDALARDADNVLALQSLVSALLQIGEPERAESLARSALARHPDDAFLHAALGTALAEKGDRTGAEAEVAAALRLDPTQSLARETMARLAR